MKILFIYRHPDMGFSIGKVFRPIEEEMRKYAEVDALYLPIPNYKPAGLWKNIRAALATVRQKKYDIIHITGTEHYLIPFLLGQNVVVTIHDLGHFYNLHGVRRIIFWIMQVFPLMFSKVITCISCFTLTELKRAIPINNHKIKVIPNEVDNIFWYKEKIINKECPIILHIGTRPHKNLSRTIEALKDITCELHIVGEIQKNDLDSLHKYKMKYLSLSNLNDNELLEEYQNADIINFPSWHEGFGMPIIEGQASGRVVVTSNMEPMKTIAGDGAAICDPFSITSIRNTYKKIISDDQYRNNIISNGFLNVKKYSVEHISKQYLELYKTL